MRIPGPTILFILILNVGFGQLHPKIGQVLITDSLLELKIMGDSLLDLSTSKQSYLYSIKADTLKLIAQENFNKDVDDKIFIISKNTIDSLFLVPAFSKHYGLASPDTLKFISLRKKIEKIENFKYIRIDEYGTWGSKRLIIKNDKSVQFSNKGYYMPSEPAENIKHFFLSDKDFKKVIDTLTQSLILLLPNARKAEHGYDPTFVDISFDINGKKWILKDISLSKRHFFMYRYLLYEMFMNR